MELSASFDVDALPLSKGVNRQTREYMGKKRKEEKKNQKKKNSPKRRTPEYLGIHTECDYVTGLHRTALEHTRQF
ncbi:MAG: hypothetical protein LBE64_14650 [Acinetobacter pittii]|jgi:hypothetical protein|nr:hypothetical protein [Acinetobacter pittii]